MDTGQWWQALGWRHRLPCTAHSHSATIWQSCPEIAQLKVAAWSYEAKMGVRIRIKSCWRRWNQSLALYFLEPKGFDHQLFIAFRFQLFIVFFQMFGFKVFKQWKNKKYRDLRWDTVDAVASSSPSGEKATHITWLRISEAQKMAILMGEKNSTVCW